MSLFPTAPTTGATSSTPAGQASQAGRGVVVARYVGDETVLEVSRSSAPLRFMQTDFPGSRACAVCVLTFGGGLVDGDEVAIDVTVGPGATLMLFTQATTKAFRGSTQQVLRATVDGGTLLLLPDPVACFRGARFNQTTEIELQGDGSCVVLDGFTAGRVAYGDRWSFERLGMTTRIFRNGVLEVRDALALDAALGSIEARMDRFEAFATLSAFGPRVSPLLGGLLAPAEIRRELVASPSPLPANPGSAPASAGNGAIVRIAASNLSTLIAAVQKRLRNLPEIYAVDPFASRS